MYARLGVEDVGEGMQALAGLEKARRAFGVGKLERARRRRHVPRGVDLGGVGVVSWVMVSWVHGPWGARGCARHVPG